MGCTKNSRNWVSNVLRTLVHYIVSLINRLARARNNPSNHDGGRSRSAPRVDLLITRYIPRYKYIINKWCDNNVIVLSRVRVFLCASASLLCCMSDTNGGLGTRDDGRRTPASTEQLTLVLLHL